MSCMVKVMYRTRIIKWPVGIGIVMGMSLFWSLSHADTIIDGPSAIGPAISSDPMTSSTLTTTEAAVRSMPSATAPRENELVLRTLPTVSKPISVRGTTLMPYIGAGFGGGYTSELDRSLNSASSASSVSSTLSNSGLKNFGQGLVPNEVQLGIRFPF